MYTVYILRTSGNTLYTGISNNLDKRLEEHRNHTKKSAKYMRSFESFELVFTEKCSNRSEALRREFKIKNLTRKEKDSLILNNEQLLFRR